jgi:hypothetical protein
VTRTKQLALSNSSEKVGWNWRGRRRVEDFI